MFEPLHRTGSRIRHSALLRRHRWLWDSIEPIWQWVFRLSSHRGFKARVNHDVLSLEYTYGARYDREGSHSYEPVVYEALLAATREGMTVFDVGAHIGLLALAAARRVGSSGRVFAFEPAPDTFRTLQNHVRFNHSEGIIEPVNAVVSDVDGERKFYVYGDSMSASLERRVLEELSPQRMSDPNLRATEITIPSVTLDRFCRDRRIEPDVIKIDVEGAELQVLLGARKLLRRKSVVILCEVHPLQMPDSTVDGLERFLDGMGYTMHRLDNPGPLAIFHTRITRRDVR